MQWASHARKAPLRAAAAAHQPDPARRGARALACAALVAMASPAGVLAVVRAAAPRFDSRQQQLAFGVHAAVLGSGYRLVAVGDAATLDGISADAPDASLAGWDASAEQFSFGYVADEEAAGATPAATPAAAAGPAKLLVKAVPLGDMLLTSLATDSSTAEPQVLELPLDDYVAAASSDAAAAAPSAGSAAKSYRQLERLCSAVSGALAALAPAAGAGSNPGGSSSSQKKQKTAEAGQQQQQQQQPPDPNYDPMRIGPPRRPLRVGHDDVMPLLGGGGGMLPGGGLPGGPPGFGPCGGGGMHVGPGHPFFADRLRHPGLLGPGQMGPGGAGGVRWDPISPEGLQGWHPDDFVRPGMGGGGRGGRGGHPDIDPDIGQPGPGRGTDWDSMYG